MTRTLRLREWEAVPRGTLPVATWDRLEAVDRRLARSARREPVLDWTRRHEVAARSLVGVFRAAGVTVEVLPKVVPDGKVVDPDPAQANLLYMLAVAGELPVSVRDLADLALERLPLLDAFAAAFAARLLDELAAGPDRGYRTREENLTCVRGRVLVAEDLRRNTVLRHRVFVRFDEFDEDTDLNRILKAATRRLLGHSSSARTRRLLTVILEDLGEVADLDVRTLQFDRLVYHRNNERFRPLVLFARAVLLGQSPAPRGGADDVFSLVFPMETLFEAFFAAFVGRNARVLGLDRSSVVVQSAGRSCHLLQRVRDGRRFARLRPDVMIEPHGEFPGLILDTKWKRLSAGYLDGDALPEAGDLYQMATYLRRFGQPVGVLLYPRTGGFAGDEFVLEGTSNRIRVETLDLSFPLLRERQRALMEFSRVIGTEVATAIHS